MNVVMPYEHQPVKPPQPVPDTALVFYKTDEKTVTAVTRHPIQDGLLGLGEVISADDLAACVSDYTKTGTGHQLIPNNLLMDNKRTLLYWEKAKRRPMWFKVGAPLKLIVTWPALLLSVDRKTRSLSAFAIANRRPAMDSRLFHAPLMNVNGQGTLCLGNAVLPDKMDCETLPECTACLTDSFFTHVNHPQTLRLSKKGGSVDNRMHLRYWKNKAKTGEPVRLAELTVYGRVADVIERW